MLPLLWRASEPSEEKRRNTETCPSNGILRVPHNPLTSTLNPRDLSPEAQDLEPPWNSNSPLPSGTRDCSLLPLQYVQDFRGSEGVYYCLGHPASSLASHELGRGFRNLQFHPLTSANVRKRTVSFFRHPVIRSRVQAEELTVASDSCHSGPRPRGFSNTARGDDRARPAGEVRVEKLGRPLSGPCRAGSRALLSLSGGVIIESPRLCPGGIWRL